MNLLVLFGLLLKASLFSTGGTGNLPILHDDLLPRGWATEKDFGQSLAVGQIAPGPSGLWVISLGYFVAGVPGSLLALIAVCLPPLLVLAISSLYHRVKHHPAIEGFVRGLSLAVVGIFAVVMVRLLIGNGITPQTLLILGVSLLLGASKRVPYIVILSLAGLAGYLLR